MSAERRTSPTSQWRWTSSSNQIRRMTLETWYKGWAISIPGVSWNHRCRTRRVQSTRTHMGVTKSWRMSARLGRMRISNRSRAKTRSWSRRRGGFSSKSRTYYRKDKIAWTRISNFWPSLVCLARSMEKRISRWRRNNIAIVRHNHQHIW